MLLLCGSNKAAVRSLDDALLLNLKRPSENWGCAPAPLRGALCSRLCCQQIEPEPKRVTWAGCGQPGRSLCKRPAVPPGRNSIAEACFFVSAVQLGGTVRSVVTCVLFRCIQLVIVAHQTVILSKRWTSWLRSCCTNDVLVLGVSAPGSRTSKRPGPQFAQGDVVQSVTLFRALLRCRRSAATSRSAPVVSMW